MASSPPRQSLYRTSAWAVLLAAAALAAVPLLRAQFARAPVASKGPRALGLLQLPPNGKGHLVPICIMVDGKFYDAAIYKASPVPMALETGTVYEAERIGMPLGLFTVTEAVQANGTWLGNGTWLEAGKEPPSKGRKAESRPREEEPDKPPVLRRPGSEKPGETKPAESKPPETKPAGPTGPEAKPGAPSTPGPTGGAPAAGEAAKATATESAPPEDANRPRLRRGVPTQPVPGQSEVSTVAVTSAKQPPSAKPAAAKGEIQQIPAISDAGGPDPRPYTYELKAQEEQEFRRKMLGLASAEILKRSQRVEAGMPSSPPAGRKTKTAAKAVKPEFENVKLSVFDLSTSNEPVLVLSAKGHPPSQGGKSGAASAAYDITLVTRVDLYGELRTIFSGVTDEQHLDVSPRMQLIDAVDVDGDGRGELLFRETSDAGSAYVVYRATADRLVPLFEGTPAGQP